jgi:tetratricopeptide (TPR) repeat protein
MRAIPLTVLFAALALAQARADNKADCYQTSDSKLAIQACTALIAANPNDAKAFFHRAIGHTGSAQTSERRKAIEDFTAVIKLEPNNREAYSRRAYSRAYIDEHKGAVEDLTKAIQLGQKEKYSYLDVLFSSRGESHFSLKQYDKAIADFSDAIKLNKSPTSLSFIRRAKAYEARGDKAKAIADYNSAAKLDPNDSAIKDALKRLGG